MVLRTESGSVLFGTCWCFATAACVGCQELPLRPLAVSVKVNVIGARLRERISRFLGLPVFCQ
jgi:hypothetical protein